MTLIDTLRVLAPLLQSGSGRVRIKKRTSYGVGMLETLYLVYGGAEHHCLFLAPAQHAEPIGPFHLLHIEATLREECAARDWTVGLNIPGSGKHWEPHAAIYFPGELVSKTHSYADTCTHALALALIKAIQSCPVDNEQQS